MTLTRHNLLDVDVDHVAGVVPLVADDLALGLPGGAVHVAQAVHTVAFEDPLDGG
jgi:hypothetical protein